MVLGRRKVEEPPVEPVAWHDVHRFVVSGVERPETVRRKRRVWGPKAVRVPQGPKDLRVLAPCAYLGTAATQPPSLPSRADHTLFEDAEARRLLCYVEPAEEVEGELRHPVRDGHGQLIGTVVRVPRKRRPFKHSWRIEQPGRPEIVGRNEWTSGGSRQFADRLGGKLLELTLDALTSFGDEGGDQGSKPRTIEWRAEDEVVMVSEGSEQVNVRADWIDRRLAFAFALIGDD